MTLGEKITLLRSERNLSQGELAEQMNVSRQSISKWETNTSIPELDKLILLCDFFQITLDELVREDQMWSHGSNGEHFTTKESHAAEEAPPSASVSVSSTQKIIGYILLAVGLLCIALSLVLGRVIFLMAVYLLICSLICLLTKRHAGLYIGWGTFLFILLLIPPLTGISLKYVIYPLYWLSAPASAAVFIAMILYLIVLLYFTALARDKKKQT